MPITLRDVATNAGVSVATASLVLSGKHANRVSPGTVHRVQTSARELNYRANRVARSLRQRSAPIIGLLSIGVATRPYAGTMLEAAQSSARLHDYDLLFVEVTNESEIDASLSLLLEHQVAGCIVAPYFHQRLDLSWTFEQPLVLLDAASSNPRIDSVVPDEVASERLILQALEDAGHAHVGWITERPKNPAAILRQQAFEAFGREHSWDERAERFAYSEAADAADGYDAFRRLIHDYADVTAVACFNDRMAMGAYMAAWELGLQIPRDISIVGFDDLTLISEGLRPGLSTVSLPHREMGQWAVERLIEQIETGGGLPGVQAALPGGVVLRGSVAAPRAGDLTTSARR